LVLTLLAISIAALVLLAIAANWASHRVVALGTAGIAAVGVLLVLITMPGGDPPAIMTLPIGPPGGSMRLSLDPLGAAFVLLLFLAAAPCAVFADAGQHSASEARAGLPASLAAALLIVLADNAFTLAVGVAALGVGGWLLLVSCQEADETGDIAMSYLGVAVVAAACLVAALALMAPPAADWLALDYSQIRAAPPEGWRAAAVVVLTYVAAAGLAGLAPLHVWLTRFGSASAWLVGAGACIGLYLLFRVVLDLCGPAQPLWWGVALIVAGAASAVLGPLRSAFVAEIEPVLAVGSLHQAGTAVVALGVALLARAADLPQVASLALGAAWLQLVAHALCRTLLLLCADAVRQGAGTRRLDRSGGLVHRMPITGACTVAGLLGAAMLPPGLGFAGFWLLFQSLLGAFVIGGFGLRLVIAFAVLLTGLSVGLAALSAVRLAGVVFLGRPRTPRTAVAEEVPLQRRLCLIGLAGLTGVLAVFPGLALLPATRAVVGLTGGPGFGMPLLLKPGVAAPGYAAVAIAGLLALAVFAMGWHWRSRGAGRRREPIWSGGFAPPPPWLPFGDPAAQAGGASFAEPLRRILPSCPTLPRFNTPRAWLRDRLRGAAAGVRQPGVPISVAVTLAALVLGLALVLATP
jgi:hydrogenase-4 component B